MTQKENIISRIQQLVRPNILALRPYSSARDEFKGRAHIWLDANENSLGSDLEEDFSRYPDPRQMDLKTALAGHKNLEPGQIFLGNGSDEAIDLLIRAFCEPNSDEIIILPPTYGMYAVQAAIQGAGIREIPLRPDFTPDVTAIQAAAGKHSKLLFLCSPNNPSGNRFPETSVRELLAYFPGLVVVDEAYVDFSKEPSLTRLLPEFPNLVILQTFSKAWGLAGLRIGMAYANPFIINVLNKIKYPYNLNVQTTHLALKALAQADKVREKIERLLNERERLMTALSQTEGVIQVYPSDANFLLVRVKDADAWYKYLCEQGIVVRNRNREIHCEGCLRMTVGSPDENDELIGALQRFNHSAI